MNVHWKALTLLAVISAVAAGQAQNTAPAASPANTTPSRKLEAAQNTPSKPSVTGQNTQTANKPQGDVSSSQTNDASLASAVEQAQEKQKKDLQTADPDSGPDVIRFKGITLSPTGSFIAAETVWREGATGGGINTAFTGVPLNNSPASQISEFYGTGRQSRLALKANGTAGSLRMTGYYETDWLGAGTTSNNNQSNSYVMRMRQLWAQAAVGGGWQFTGGQMWSLTTETTHGLDNGTEILPATIDPQYEAGFVWNRQYGFRATKDFSNKLWFGASVENDQMLVGGSSLPSNELIGSMGTNGGLFNSTTTYSFNLAPELVAKLAVEPGWGHWEVFGVGRFFHERVYPNETSANAGTAASAVGAYDDSTVGGGIGGGFRAPLGTKNLTIGLKGLYGDGTGRMGSSTIEDTALQPDGQLALLHTFSALSTLEANLGKRLMVYFNYGGDYVGRRYFGTSGEGYGSPYVNMSGCTVETASANSNGYAASAPTAPANCGGNTKDVQEFTAGEWYNFYNGTKGRLRFGLQYSRLERDLWSGKGGTTNPGGGAHGIDNMFWTSFRYYLP